MQNDVKCVLWLVTCTFGIFQILSIIVSIFWHFKIRIKLIHGYKIIYTCVYLCIFSVLNQIFRLMKSFKFCPLILIKLILMDFIWIKLIWIQVIFDIYFGILVSMIFLWIHEYIHKHIYTAYRRFCAAQTVLLCW